MPQSKEREAIKLFLMYKCTKWWEIIEKAVNYNKVRSVFEGGIII